MRIAPMGLCIWMIGYQEVTLFERIGGKVLWEEMCHWGWALWFSEAQARPSDSLFLLPEDPDVEL